MKEPDAPIMSPIIDLIVICQEAVSQGNIGSNQNREPEYLARDAKVRSKLGKLFSPHSGYFAIVRCDRALTADLGQVPSSPDRRTRSNIPCSRWSCSVGRLFISALGSDVVFQAWV